MSPVSSSCKECAEHSILAVKMKEGCLAAVATCGGALKKIAKKVHHLFQATVRQISRANQEIRAIVPGSKNRIVLGAGFNANFTTPVSEELIQLMDKFMTYALTSEAHYQPLPITPAQRQQLEMMINENAHQDDVKYMKAFLQRCDENPGFSPRCFDGHDYACIEKASFELIKEFTKELPLFFNAGVMTPVQEGIKREFHMSYYEAVIAEILARSIAYKARLHGEKMMLPVHLEDGQYGLAEFAISLYFLGDQLPAYVLECKDQDGKDLHHPWFVVRGTDANASKTEDGHRLKVGTFESVLADTINPDGIGEGVVDGCLYSGKEVHIRSQLYTQNSLASLFKNRKFKLSGHSLGGTIVGQMATFLYHHVEAAYAFSAPAASDRTAEQWTKKSKEDEYKLFNIQPQGDPFAGAGKRLIGEHIAITPLAGPIENAVRAHVAMSLTKPFEIHAVDKKLEEAQTSRQAIELTRRVIGCLMRGVMEVVLRWDLPEWYKRRDIFLIDDLTLSRL